MGRGEPRPVLFVLVALALVSFAAALLLRDAPGQPDAGRPAADRERSPTTGSGLRREGVARRRDLPPSLRRGLRAVAVAARRFLAAYLRYEVGEGSASVRAALRSASTARFAAQLLASPPRLPASGAPPRATMIWLEVTPRSGAAPEALVRGALRRRGRVEPFSFRFARRGRPWLAAGVAE